jgi:HAD superfamily hydrolase (TIGR01509 family)
VTNVLLAVQPDGMALGEHAGDQVRLGRGAGGDGEERRGSASLAQQIKEIAGHANVGAVVEGQRERGHPLELPGRDALVPPKVRGDPRGQYGQNGRNQSRVPGLDCGYGDNVAVAILDIDGTLVDTNYQHSLAWFRAFRRFDIVLPIWRIHRHIGMGGDQVVTALCGEEVEDRNGDGVREAEGEEYQRLIGEVQAFDRARELIVALKDRGHAVVLASSAKAPEVEHYLGMLEAADIVDGWTTSDDVENTKPAPDLVAAGLDRVGGDADDAVMVGDTPWDIEAAAKAGVPTYAVVTGGFSEQELREAGARDVYESVAKLERGLDKTDL